MNVHDSFPPLIKTTYSATILGLDLQLKFFFFFLGGGDDKELQ